MFVTNRQSLVPEFFHHTGNKRAGEQFLVRVVHTQFGAHVLHEVLHITHIISHYEGGKITRLFRGHANLIHFVMLALALTDWIELGGQARVVEALCPLVVEVSTAHMLYSRIHSRVERPAARTPLVTPAIFPPKPVTATERTSPHTSHIRAFPRVYAQQHTLAVDTLSRG